MTWSPYKTTCVCGCDIDSHYRDPATGERVTCLHCRDDSCRAYRDALAPPTPPAPKPISTIPVPAPSAPKPIDVGERVRVVDSFSLFHMCEGEVLEIRPHIFSHGLSVKVRLDDGTEVWMDDCHLQVI